MLVVSAQLLSSNILISSRTCSHSKKTVYELGKTTCKCPTEKKKTSCCSSKESTSETSVSQICCDIDEFQIDFEYQKDLDHKGFKKQLVEAEIPVISIHWNNAKTASKDYSQYNPPPDKFHGLNKRILLQSFII